MKDVKRPRRTKVEIANAGAWRGFWSSPEGRAAIGALMTEFGVYSPGETNDPHAALRREGQRDVLLRITMLVGLRPQHFPDEAWETTDVLDQLMRQ